MTTQVDSPRTTRLDANRRAAKRRNFIRDVSWRYVVLVAVSIYAVFPLMYVVSTAFNPRGTIAGSNNLFQQLTLSNFQDLFAGKPYWNWFANTVIIGLTTGLGTVLMGSAAAYAFSRFRFKGRSTTLSALLVIQMFPQLLAFIAIYLLLMKLGDITPLLGLDSRFALIMVYLGGALGTNLFLLYGFFNTVPKEIDEAAKLDGASHARIFWTIIMRLVVPILSVVGLLAFISSFSDFILARLVLTTDVNKTLAVGLYEIAKVQFGTNWGMFTAGALIAAVPVVVLFFALQKYIVSGLTAGSVKG